MSTVHFRENMNQYSRLIKKTPLLAGPTPPALLGTALIACATGGCGSTTEGASATDAGASAVIAADGSNEAAPLQAVRHPTEPMEAGLPPWSARESDAKPPTYEPTLAAIQAEIFAPTCAAAFCHYDDQLGFNAVSLERSYDTLVNVTSDTELCGPTGLERVVPGDPSQSLLYLKLTDPPCGDQMPRLFNQNLDPRAIEQIRTWIENGALKE